MNATRTFIRRARSFRQAGLTLIETLVALSIFAVVVGGALALFGSASASQATTQLASDLNSLRAATKALYFGQGSYGTNASLSEVLINAKKVPTTMSITGATPNRIINHSLNGQVTVVGNNSQITVKATNIPTEVCIGLATMTGWDSVQIGAAAPHLPPVTPSQASTECANGAPQAMTFIGS
jgi:prepilin-type N-terminal cleavage/methylation domain-containing protein